MSRRNREQAGTAATAEDDAVTLRLPTAEPPASSYISREDGHIDVNLRGAALPYFRRVHEGLVESGARLANGRPVASKGDVVQYVFERIAELSA